MKRRKMRISKNRATPVQSNKPNPYPNDPLKPPRPKMSNVDRSAYFARREAAKVLKTVLQGDAKRQASASIKSIVFGPSVRNKKATFALVCQTLKHFPIIKEVLEMANGVLTGRWKEKSLVGDAEKSFELHRRSLEAALARVLVRKKVKSVGQLLALYQIKDVLKPRYVRVNTMKLDVESAIQELSTHYKVLKDDLVPDLLILPPGSDLHDHPLLTNGSLFLQGKASSMVAVALAPNPKWTVLDPCAAPGNKTVHLAALMGGQGKVIACELNKERAKRLENTVTLSGASNIKIFEGDFLSLNPSGTPYSSVRAILLDPSCLGSGTASDRLDHLLPSSAEGNKGPTFADTERLNKLSAFQKKALSHALSFPEVERVVYSTCSINQAENEDVVASILPLAISLGFHLETALPKWPRLGLPVVEGCYMNTWSEQIQLKTRFFHFSGLTIHHTTPREWPKWTSNQEIQNKQLANEHSFHYKALQNVTPMQKMNTSLIHFSR